MHILDYMNDKKVDVEFFEYLEIAYLALMLFLHSLSIKNMFVSHIILGYVYIELRFCEL